MPISQHIWLHNQVFLEYYHLCYATKFGSYNLIGQAFHTLYDSLKPGFVRDKETKKVMFFLSFIDCDFI